MRISTNLPLIKTENDANFASIDGIYINERHVSEPFGVSERSAAVRTDAPINLLEMTSTQKLLDEDHIRSNDQIHQVCFKSAFYLDWKNNALLVPLLEQHVIKLISYDEDVEKFELSTYETGKAYIDVNKVTGEMKVTPQEGFRAIALDVEVKRVNYDIPDHPGFVLPTNVPIPYLEY